MVILAATRRPGRGIAQIRAKGDPHAVSQGDKLFQPIEVVLAGAGLIIVPAEASPPLHDPELAETAEVAGDFAQILTLVVVLQNGERDRLGDCAGTRVWVSGEGWAAAGAAAEHSGGKDSGYSVPSFPSLPTFHILVLLLRCLSDPKNLMLPPAIITPGDESAVC